MRLTLARSLTLALVAGALPLMSQTTGTMQGRVLDSKGRPLQGAIVQVTGAGVQGGRYTTSGADGTFWFGLLAPGTVTLTVTNPGHNTSKLSVLVGLGKTASAEVKLSDVSAVVEVVDQLTTIDVKGTTTGANFTAETFETLPVARDFAAVALFTPGVGQDILPNGETGLRVYGASGTENNYVVDGINTTNAEFGVQGKKIPVEFIQEFQLKTGGYEAEYGKSTGGIVNVITKSGGNTFTGDLFSYLEDSGFQAPNKHLGQASTIGFTPLQQGYRNFDYGFDVGGYFIKDKVWFFVAYDRTDYSRTDVIQQGSTIGQLANRIQHTDLFSAKVTWKITENQSLIASVLGDPSTISGEVDGHSAIGPQSTWDGLEKIGGTDLSLKYEVSGNSWFGELQASKHRESNTILPQPSGADIPQVQLLDGSLSGGFGRWDRKNFDRTSYTGSVTRLVDLAGSHELKAGFDWQEDDANCSRNFSGGQSIVAVAVLGGQTYYSHAGWTGPFDQIPNTPFITFFAKPVHKSFAYFIQDKWTPTSRLTINAGIRNDETRIIDQGGVQQIDLKNQWAPRLGVTYDWAGKGQDKVYASFSRFYQQMPMDLVIRSFSYERQPTIYNFIAGNGPGSTVPNDQGGFTSSIVGGYVEPVDRDLKGEYMDQFIMGVETTVADRYVLGAKFIRSYFGRIIEDALDVSPTSVGDYYIMNPGQSHNNGVQYPQAVRDFRGLELTFQRKLADHYTYSLSYLWSKLNGNFEGGYGGVGGQNNQGQVDPGISAAFDLPQFLVNNYGPLSTDRRSQFKANGSYETSFGLTIGASAQYMSGIPINRMGSSDAYAGYSGRWELFLAPRGSEGRTPDTFMLNLNFVYVVKLAKQRLSFLMDVTNVLDSQTTTNVDSRYDLVPGTANPNFLQPITYQAPRSIRLGVRYSF